MSTRAALRMVVAVLVIGRIAPVAARADETTIYSFTNNSVPLQSMPANGVIAGPNGSLYGLASVLAFKLTPPSGTAHAWTLTKLHVFAGEMPEGSLVSDSAGALYGVTQFGPSGHGSVFRLAPPSAGRTAWSYKRLYQFSGGADGNTSGDLVVADGALYGTASTYDSSATTYGVAYRLAPPVTANGPWQYSVIYRFNKITGNGLSNLLARSVNGVLTLFGASFAGGPNPGTLYQLTAPSAPATTWQFKTIYSFSGPDGSGPSGDLVADNGLNLYGTTITGGPNNAGVVFRLTPPTPPQQNWTESVLQTNGGLLPQGRLAQFDGSLFGVTITGGTGSCGDRGFGCGTLFKVTPRDYGGHALPWNKTIVSNFAVARGGNSPSGNLVVRIDGPDAFSIYGTTGNGGLDNVGTVYRLRLSP